LLIKNEKKLKTSEGISPMKGVYYAQQKGA
jgi:hypothetical protein